MLVEQIAEQNRAEDQAQKVHVEQVAMALKDKFIYVQDSENEVEGEREKGVAVVRSSGWGSYSIGYGVGGVRVG